MRALLLAAALVASGCHRAAPVDLEAAHDPAPSAEPAPAPVEPVAPVDAPREPAHASTPAPEAHERRPRPRPFVTVVGDTWRLVASIHPSLPRYAFSVRGRLERVEDEGGGKPVWFARGPGESLAPDAIVVERPGLASQRLVRGAPVHHALDMDTWAGVDPLRLAPHASFGANVGAGDLALADYDFDGYLDLEVTIGLAAKCTTKQVWLFDPGANAFRELPVIRQLGCVSLDHQQKAIVSSSWTCCERFASFYELQAGQLVKVGGRHVAYQAPGDVALPEGAYWLERAWGKGVGSDGRTRGIVRP